MVSAARLVEHAPLHRSAPGAARAPPVCTRRLAVVDDAPAALDSLAQPLELVDAGQAGAEEAPEVLVVEVGPAGGGGRQGDLPGSHRAGESAIRFPPHREEPPLFFFFFK